MAKFKGHGGFWVVTDPLQNLPAVVVHNAEYTVVTVEEIRQSRTANGKGWTEGLPVVRRIEQATFRVAEDDVSYPQVLGFTEGAEIAEVYLRRGSLNRFDRITRTIVERVRVDNDQKKARWVEVVCKHGRYERQQPAPTNPDGSPVVGSGGTGTDTSGDAGGGGDF